MSDCPTKARISPLHCHTSYSVLDGASSIDEYIKWCVDHDAPAFATTDHGWCIGALETYLKAKKAGKVGIPGCEFYLAPDGDYAFNGKPYDYYHVTAWAVTEQGYRNLLKLATISWHQDTLPGWEKKGDRYAPTQKSRVVKRFGQTKPRISFDELLTHHEGLVLGSGCLIGSLSKAFLQGEFKGAERNLLRLLEVYQGRLFCEIMPESCTHDFDRDTKKFVPIDPDGCNGMCIDGDIQKGVNLKIIETARKHGLPLLLTIDSHFVRPEQKALQDVLLQNGDPDGWRFHSVYAMLTTEQAWEKWKKTYGSDAEQRKIFTEAVESNQTIADLAKGLQINDRYHQPAPEIPTDIQIVTQDPREQRKVLLLRQIDYHGRMKWNEPVWVERLKTELDVICDNGVVDFSDYFLFLERWCRWAADHSILTAPGRGSAAGSLLSYLLKITHLDPIEFDLPFERFLSKGRINRKKWPDVDLDLGGRDILIAKLREHYGDKMAQCSTHQTLKVRSAIKDACRALLGWTSSDARVEEVTKTIDNEPQGVASKDFLLGYKDQDGHFHDGQLMSNDKLNAFFEKYPQVKDMVLQLLGIPRSVGRHASAYLISDEPIHLSVPTCDIGGYTCTQYTAAAANNMVEKAGLIKFDLLRINTLDDISGCIRLVQKKMGYKVWEEKICLDNETFTITKGDLRIDQLPMPDGQILDIYKLPPDQLVFSDLSAGRTETVFQMNSPLMTGFTKRIKPRSLHDLSDIVALVRPGPLEASVGEKDDRGEELTMTEAYIARRNGILPIRYAHDGMEPILKKSYGVAVYQEQLQKMFQQLAGYSSEEADELREILAKKQRQELEARLPVLRKRLKASGWSESQIQVFSSLCVASSAYSFNLAHSASYGSVAYMCAFLKTHFPLEWWTAVLQNAKVEDIRDKNYVKAVKDLLVLPHVNGPTDTFRLEEGKIHAPIYLIDRVGDSASSAILEEREKNGPFKSFQDFFERIDKQRVDQTVFHNLILCEAFRLIEPDKAARELLEQYHYCRRVTNLKIGRGKLGDELQAAVKAYKEQEIQEGTKLDVPELYMDRLATEVARLKALPIYRSNVHEDFRQVLLAKGALYDNDRATIRYGIQLFRLYRNVAEIAEMRPGQKGLPGAWAGLLQDAEPFNYKDKKTGKQVTALKMQISNDGDALECVMWPDLYAELKDPPANKILLVFGMIKEAREPGKWSVSIQKIKYF